MGRSIDANQKLPKRYRYHRYVSIFVDDANALGEHSSLRLPFYESQRNQLDLTGGQRSLLRIRHQQTLQFSGRFSSATAFFVRWRSGPASWWPILLTPVSMMIPFVCGLARLLGISFSTQKTQSATKSHVTFCRRHGNSNHKSQTINPIGQAKKAKQQVSTNYKAIVTVMTTPPPSGRVV